tara:strand:- start:1242 stop:1817 length:576 start_codon:yes stop_codon:yes gene_type:complete
LSKDHFEVVLVDDNEVPSQKLQDVCTAMGDVLNVRLIQNKKNMGLPTSLNNILKTARGKYFVRVDSDDYVSRHFLYMLSTMLEMNRSYQAVCCDYMKVDHVGQKLGYYDSFSEPIACGVMFSYEALCSLNFYNEEYKMREGHELLERFQKKYSMYHLKAPLYRYRIHEENRTNNVDKVAYYDSKLKGEQDG